MQLPYKFGRYQLVRKVAVGGMAEIYKAKYFGESGFVKDVAVKRILPAWCGDKSFVTMLCDEAKALGHLQHQNIVQVYELGRDCETYYISMEYIEGIDVRKLFKKISSAEEAAGLPVKFACFIISEMLKALDCAHTRKGRDGKELGIIHRDVSPQNVLLSFSGEVKVADFGIAKGSHRSFETITTQVKGKYAYMSPEQALGRQLDARCDLYAVGVMLYELITGKRLHEAPNDLMTLEEVKNSALPNGWGMSVPMGIRPIIRKALKKNIEERYQTAQEFLDDLNKFVVANRLSTHGIEFSVYLKERFKKECDDAISDDGAEKECSMAGVGQRTNVLSIVSGGIQKVSKRWKRCVFTAVPAAIAVAAAFLAVSWLGANKVQDRQPIAPAEQAVPTASAATQQPPVVLLTKKEELPNIPDAPKPIGRPEISEHSAKMELVKKESKSSAVSGTASSSSDAAQSQRSVVSVQAKPWGYVYIPGVVDRRETPVRNVRLDPGEYVVKVNYEPEDKWVQQKIKLAANSRLVCVADFAGRKNMTCKTMP